MSYERYNEQDDEQQPVRQWNPGMRTQPTPYRPGSVDPRDADPASGYGPGGVSNPSFGQGGAIRPPGSRPMGDVQNDFMSDPRHAHLSQQQRQGAFNGLMSLGMGGGNPLGGPNSGVTGGADMGTASPGGADREWRKSLTYGGGPGTMSGFNTSGAGYDDKAANSVKNTFGRIAQRYPNTPEGLRQAVNDPDFKRAFPNARLVEGGVGDKIDFGGVLSDFESGSPVGVVDVGQAFDLGNNSGAAWAWMPEGEGGDMGGGGMGGMGGGMGLPNLQTILAGSDPLTDIIKRIEDLQGGGTPEAEQQALIQMIRGEELI